MTVHERQSFARCHLHVVTKSKQVKAVRARQQIYSDSVTL